MNPRRIVPAEARAPTKTQNHDVTKHITVAGAAAKSQPQAFQNFVLKQFHFGQLFEKERSQRILVLGPSNSGKSNFLFCLLRYCTQHCPFDLAFAWTSTSTTAQGLTKYIPPSCIHQTGLDERGLAHFTEFVRVIKGADANIIKSKRRILIVLDDVTDNKKALASPAIDYLWKMGRQANITVILNVQTATDFRPEYRKNTNWLFVLKPKQQSATKQLADFFAGSDPKQFMSLINTITASNDPKQRYRYMAVDTGCISPDVRSYVYWGKEPDHSLLPELPVSKKIPYPLVCATANMSHRKFYKPINHTTNLAEQVSALPPALRSAIGMKRAKHHQPTTEESSAALPDVSEDEVVADEAVIFTGRGAKKTSEGIILRFVQPKTPSASSTPHPPSSSPPSLFQPSPKAPNTTTTFMHPLQPARVNHQSVVVPPTTYHPVAPLILQEKLPSANLFSHIPL